MGSMTEHSLDDIVANLSQVPTMTRIVDLMAEQAQHQMELLRRIVSLPKSESRLAWEAVHPSWVENLMREPEVATSEMQRAGCRR
jgi:hypothetical protein